MQEEHVILALNEAPFMTKSSRPFPFTGYNEQRVYYDSSSSRSLLFGALESGVFYLYKWHLTVVIIIMNVVVVVAIIITGHHHCNHDLASTWNYCRAVPESVGREVFMAFRTYVFAFVFLRLGDRYLCPLGSPYRHCLSAARNSCVRN